MFIMLEELLLKPTILNSLCQVCEILPFSLKLKDIYPYPFCVQEPETIHLREDCVLVDH